MKKGILLLFALAILILAVGCVSAAEENQTLEIDNALSAGDSEVLSFDESAICENQTLSSEVTSDNLSATSDESYQATDDGDFLEATGSDYRNTAKIKITYLKRTYAPIIQAELYDLDTASAIKNQPVTFTIYKGSQFLMNLYVKSDANGVVSVVMPLTAGIYNVLIKFNGNGQFTPSSTKMKLQVVNGNGPVLYRNKIVKWGNYYIQIPAAKYKSLVLAYKKNVYRSILVKTGYYKTYKIPYYKTVTKVKRLNLVRTWYGSYLAAFKNMYRNGWSRVSEYTYWVKNPDNARGIGLSAYQHSVSTWVKKYCVLSYKYQKYPILANILVNTNSLKKVPVIFLYTTYGYRYAEGYLNANHLRIV